MKAIYAPTGKAREYSPLALNLYNGCDHRCDYCYVPMIQHKSAEDYATVTPKTNILKKLERDLANNTIREQVLLSFAGDPFCKAELGYCLTHRALTMLNQAKVAVALLTKGGRRVESAFDTIREFDSRIKVGATIVFATEDEARKREPGAAPIEERIDMLATLKAAGIRTWISLEPVIDPDEALAVIAATLDVCDEYRIGKLNYQSSLAKDEWVAFTDDALHILRRAKKMIYVKDSLRTLCPADMFHAPEIIADAWTVK